MTYDQVVNKYQELKLEQSKKARTDKKGKGCLQFAINAAYQQMIKHPDYK